MSTPRQWLTVNKAAAYLGVSVTTLRRWCDDEKIPHWLFGKERRFETGELEEWLERRRREEHEPASPS